MALLIPEQPQSYQPSCLVYPSRRWDIGRPTVLTEIGGFPARYSQYTYCNCL